MAITVKTSNPTGLLASIKQAVKDGTVETWTCDADGDFTHNPTQWNKKAYLKPSTETAGELRFSILRPNDVTTLSDTIKGVYHGRFIEMLVTHFTSKFMSAAALP